MKLIWSLLASLAFVAVLSSVSAESGFNEDEERQMLVSAFSRWLQNGKQRPLGLARLQRMDPLSQYFAHRRQR